MSILQTSGFLAARCLGLFALVGAAVPLASCTTVECGEGTIERGGTCVTTDVDPGTAACGPGTELGADGKCKPIFPATVCEEGTTIETPDPETGVIVCQGTGGGLNCNASITCPQASSGKVTICGQLLDIKDDSPIRDPAPTGAACNPASPTAEGPCSLELQFYDAIDFANNPGSATQLGRDEVVIDDCGRFRAVNVTRPALGFLGIGINDSDEGATPPADRFALTGVATAVISAERRTGFPAYVVPKAVDAMWLSSSGIGGASFESRGVFMPIFRAGVPPAPRAGVVITKAGNPQPADDYYFSDATATARTTIDAAQNATGANGAGLILNSALLGHSGTSTPPLASGCNWSNDLGKSLPTVIFVTVRDALNASGQPCE